VPLLCVRCQFPIQAQVDEVAWICQQCGQGLGLDETPSGKTAALPLDFFFSSSIPQGQTGRPFWVCNGRVTITQRMTYKGNESNASQAFWSSPHLFFFPAYAASLDDVVRLGVDLLKNPVSMDPGPIMPFSPVVTPPTDLGSLAEFMVMTIEAGRKDAMKRLEFSIDLAAPELWVLPGIG